MHHPRSYHLAHLGVEVGGEAAAGVMHITPWNFLLGFDDQSCGAGGDIHHLRSYHGAHLGAEVDGEATVGVMRITPWNFLLGFAHHP